MPEKRDVYGGHDSYRREERALMSNTQPCALAGQQQDGFSSSRAGGKFQIYTMNANGTAQTRITFSGKQDCDARRFATRGACADRWPPIIDQNRLPQPRIPRCDIARSHGPLTYVIAPGQAGRIVSDA
jgi:hypothetical protein